MSLTPLQSLPALAAALRQTDRRRFPAATSPLLTRRSLVETYQIDEGSMADESSSAIHTLNALADRLRRLATAYGEWRTFDPPAYFDLFTRQAALLVRVSERVGTVHVTFYADLLFPSFQQVEQYWAQEFFPAYQSAHPFATQPHRRSTYNEFFLEIVQPKMVAYWQRVTAVLAQTREQLLHDPGFLACAAGGEERDRWRAAWNQPAARGLDPQLSPPLAELPSLTLSVTFPLPAHRQPGRLRRLRRRWQQGGRFRPGRPGRFS